MNPRDPVEMAVAALWNEVLPTSTFGVTDDFFEVGGDSLIAIRLSILVQHEFGLEIPTESFLENPTIEGMAGSVRDHENVSASATTRLQIGDVAQTPLLLLPPVSGTVTLYTALVRELPDERPVVAVQSRGLREGEEPCQTVEAIAEEFAARLREAVSQPVVHVAGYSMGGLIAFELARLLAESDDMPDPGMVGLLDTRSASTELSDPDFALRALLFRVLEIETPIEELMKMPEDDRLEFLVDEGVARGQLPTGFDAAGLGRMISMYGHNLEAMAGYAPTTYPGTLTLFRAMDRSLEDPPLPDDLGWSEHATDLELANVPGDHFSMVDPDNCHTLAAAMDRAMRESESAQTAPAV